VWRNQAKHIIRLSGKHRDEKRQGVGQNGSTRTKKRTVKQACAVKDVGVEEVEFVVVLALALPSKLTRRVSR
jgi:hypothetical protein